LSNLSPTTKDDQVNAATYLPAQLNAFKILKGLHPHIKRHKTLSIHNRIALKKDLRFGKLKHQSTQLNLQSTQLNPQSTEIPRIEQG